MVSRCQSEPFMPPRPMGRFTCGSFRFGPALVALNTPLLKITKELGLTFRVKTTASRDTSIKYTTTVDGQEAGFAGGSMSPPPRKHKRGQPNDVWTGGGGIPIFQIRKSGSMVKVVIDVGGVEQVSRSFHVRRC